MQLKRFDDIREFYSRVEPFLLTYEADYNLMLGISGSLLDRSAYQDFPPYLASVEEAGEVVAVAMRTPPHNIILSYMAPEASQCIAEDLAELYGDGLPGITGPTAECAVFAEQWEALTGKHGIVVMEQRLYQLDTVNPVSGVSGSMRPMEERDRDMVIKWVLDFHSEAMGAINRLDAEANVNRFLTQATRLPYIWEDAGQSVSLVVAGNPTPNGMRIGPVYTPPEFRQRGYASACTAGVSQKILDLGKTFCFLYTDQANPTSNHIYQQIGYYPVGDSHLVRFL